MMFICRLYEIGKGDVPLYQDEIRCAGDVISCSDESSPKAKQSHCSFCGHPGSKRAHFKFSCEYCVTDSNEGCLKKSLGFKCNCSSCVKVKFLCCLSLFSPLYHYYLTAYGSVIFLFRHLILCTLTFKAGTRLFVCSKFRLCEFHRFFAK